MPSNADIQEGDLLTTSGVDGVTAPHPHRERASHDHAPWAAAAAARYPLVHCADDFAGADVQHAAAGPGRVDARHAAADARLLGRARARQGGHGLGLCAGPGDGCAPIVAAGPACAGLCSGDVRRAAAAPAHGVAEHAGAGRTGAAAVLAGRCAADADAHAAARRLSRLGLCHARPVVRAAVAGGELAAAAAPAPATRSGREPAFPVQAAGGGHRPGRAAVLWHLAVAPVCAAGRAPRRPAGAGRKQPHRRAARGAQPPGAD
ncbi:hypothetical protein FQA39_LY18748 [Lamprigera yunnana]|nr:hypothetical protein FQA39_LY18748 [Lamprigera yunnana]